MREFDTITQLTPKQASLVQKLLEACVREVQERVTQGEHGDRVVAEIMKRIAQSKTFGFSDRLYASWYQKLLIIASTHTKNALPSSPALVVEGSLIATNGNDASPGTSSPSQNIPVLLAQQGKKENSRNIIPLQSSILGRDIDTQELVSIDQHSSTYIIGKAGSGKTTLLVNMIVQAIEQGHGLCFLDPHEDAITEIIKRLPSHREQDVILLDIADTEYTFGLNLFHCDNPQDEREVSRVTSMVMGVFARLFTESGDLLKDAPNMARTLQNVVPVLLSHTNPRMTMAEIPLLFENEDARAKLIRRVTNSQVSLFWQQYNRWRSEKQNELTSSTSNRVGNFLNDSLILKIIGQSETTLPFRRLMDEQKILLVKLSRNHELISNLIGSILVGQIALAAFSRVDTPEENRVPFYLFVDEFQNFATSTFAQILAETRKYRVYPVIAHQWRGQLDKQNREATLNAANLVVYQVSGADAEELANQYDRSPIPGEVRLEHTRVISPTPVDTIVLGRPHKNNFVNEFFKSWRELAQKASSPIREGATPGSSSASTNRHGVTKTYSRPGRSWTNRNEVEEAQEWLDTINDILYQVMIEKNPRKIVPLELLGWRITQASGLFAENSQTKIVVDFSLFPDYVAWLVHQPTNEQMALYNRLWNVPDTALVDALFAFEQEARRYLRATIDALFTPFLEEVNQLASVDNLRPYDLHRSLEQGKTTHHLGFLDLNALTVFAFETTYQRSTIANLPLTSTLQAFPRPLYLWQWDEESRKPLFEEIINLILLSILERKMQQAKEEKTRSIQFAIDFATRAIEKEEEQIVQWKRDKWSIIRYQGIFEGNSYFNKELAKHEANIAEHQQSLAQYQRELPTVGQRVEQNRQKWLDLLKYGLHLDFSALQKRSWCAYFQDPSYPFDSPAPAMQCSPETVRTAIINEIISVLHVRFKKPFQSSYGEKDEGFHVFSEKDEQLVRRTLQSTTFQGSAQYWEAQTKQSEVDVQTSLSLPTYQSSDEAAKREYKFTFKLHVHAKWLETIQANLQAEIDRMVAAQKPAFEQLVRDFRHVLAILATEPISELSSVLEEKPVDLSSAEVAARIANILANPKQKYTARCKLADGQEHTITVLPSHTPEEREDWQERLSRIKTNTRLNYCKKRSEVNEEIIARQSELMKPEKQQSRTKQSED